MIVLNFLNNVLHFLMPKKQRSVAAPTNKVNNNHYHNYVKTKKSYTHVEKLPLASMTIYYVDENGHPLKSFDILNGKLNENTKFIIPDFDHYVLCNIEGDTRVFKHRDNQVIIHYMKLSGKPVNVFFINYDTYSMVKMPEMVLGRFGDAFEINVPSLQGFNIITYSGAKEGYFNDQVQNLVIYYRRSDWNNVERVNYYVKLRKYTPVFNDTAGDIYNVFLPKDSTWKVFYRVKSHNCVWLNIGPNQWIKDLDYAEIHYPFAKQLVDSSSWQITATNYSAIVNNNRVSVPVYNYPYGSCLKFLHANDVFKVTHQIVDNHQTTWLEINDLYFIVDKYVQKKD